uniref:Immunoglobulin V-set domain-containing protein n=1 Tax=Lates calcarifer TaxID=8187 RepID=A0A4W6FSV0_LATCA
MYFTDPVREILVIFHLSITAHIDIYKKPKEEARINCSHSIDNYYAILWYKQLKDKQLQFLGYMNLKDGVPEAGAVVKIEGDANKGQTCTLIIERLVPNNSAVYFCAASYHSATYHCSSVQKPHHHVFLSVLQLSASCTCINPF